MHTTRLNERVTLDIQLDPHQSESDLEQLRRGLTTIPRSLPSKYFYDARGSSLFESITRLPEYYPTRTERRLLEESAAEIATLTGAEELVELGAGAATKTRLLLDAMQATEQLRLYVPLDVSAAEVRRVAEELAHEYPRLQVHGIVADFVHHMSSIPPGDPRLVILLGSTIGNFPPDQATRLLQDLSEQMSPGDYFLLGADLVKDSAVLESAYNDSAGVTAEFNLNILRVVNSVTGADFDPAAFSHRALYDSQHNRIEMYVVADRAQRVELPKLSLSLELDQGEAIRTEISCKYDRASVEAMLRQSGFELDRWFSDPRQYFALALARKV